MLMVAIIKKSHLYCIAFFIIFLSILSGCDEHTQELIRVELEAELREIAREAVDNQVSDIIDNVQFNPLQWLEDMLGQFRYSENDNNDRYGIPSVTREKEIAHDHQMQRAVFALLDEERFSEATWETLDVAKKRIVLTEFLSEVQEIMGTSADSNIRFFYEQRSEIGVIGGRYIHTERPFYSFRRRTVQWIEINEYILNMNYRVPFIVIIHEVRHSYQREAIDDPLRHIVSNETRTVWERNIDNYVRFQHGVDEYRQQPIEWDAFNFARQTDVLSGLTPEYEGSWGR